MLSWNKLEGEKRETADLGHYSVRIAIVLSLVVSLMAVAILSKKHIMNDIWADLGVFAVPMFIGLYFRNRIVLLGFNTFVAAMIIALVAAILFGI